MEQFNVALALERLVPAAQYGNSLTANSKKAYNALRWHDERPKPAWEDVQAAGQALLQELDTPTRQDAAKALLGSLPAAMRAKYYKDVVLIRDAINNNDWDVVSILLDNVTPDTEDEIAAFNQIKQALGAE